MSDANGNGNAGTAAGGAAGGGLEPTSSASTFNFDPPAFSGFAGGGAAVPGQPTTSSTTLAAAPASGGFNFFAHQAQQQSQQQPVSAAIAPPSTPSTIKFAMGVSYPTAPPASARARGNGKKLRTSAPNHEEKQPKSEVEEEEMAIDVPQSDSKPAPVTVPNQSSFFPWPPLQNAQDLQQGHGGAITSALAQPSWLTQSSNPFQQHQQQQQHVGSNSSSILTVSQWPNLAAFPPCHPSFSVEAPLFGVRMELDWHTSSMFEQIRALKEANPTQIRAKRKGTNISRSSDGGSTILLDQFIECPLEIAHSRYVDQDFKPYPSLDKKESVQEVAEAVVVYHYDEFGDQADIDKWESRPAIRFIDSVFRTNGKIWWEKHPLFFELVHAITDIPAARARVELRQKLLAEFRAKKEAEVAALTPAPASACTDKDSVSKDIHLHTIDEFAKTTQEMAKLGQENAKAEQQRAIADQERAKQQMRADELKAEEHKYALDSVCLAKAGKCVDDPDGFETDEEEEETPRRPVRRFRRARIPRRGIPRRSFTPQKTKTTASVATRAPQTAPKRLRPDDSSPAGDGDVPAAPPSGIKRARGKN